MSTKQNHVLLNFNRGVISELGLARQDIERISLSAALQNNFMPRVLGSMMLRAGFGYKGSVYQSKKPYHVPFIYDDEDSTDVAVIELTDGKMRVIIDDNAVSRAFTSTGITNGEFTSDISGWTNADEAGALSSYQTGGYLSLVGTRYNAARLRQQVAVAGLYHGVEHALRIVVSQGELLLKVGSSAGGEQYIEERVLEKGTHSVAFTPTGDFHVQLANRNLNKTLVDSCTVETSGDLIIDTTWTESDLPNIRYDQSGDVIYVACRGQIQKKILRYSTTSWSLVDYKPKNGPFRNLNTTKTTITPSAVSGNITLTASTSIFSSGNVGSLYRISSVGQTVQISVTGENQWSDPIRVTGVGSVRSFQVNVDVDGSWSGTIRMQQSVGDDQSWTDYSSYTTDTTATASDGLDNQIIYYRIGCKTGEYSAGSAACSLVYAYGSISGIVNITGYTSGTVVSAEVLTELGNTTATDNWEEGEWSPRRGYPSALALHDGRLWHGGIGKVFASESDGYESFDDTVEGDSVSFTRNIPRGSRSVKWMLSLKRLMFGTQTHEWFVKSSSQDEVVTNSNVNLKSTSNQGCAPVQALEVDGVGVFVQKSTARVFQSGYTIDVDDFRTEDLSKIIPEFLEAGVVRMAIQRQPDTRIHCVLNDGTVVILILDTLEDVKSWVTVSTDGEIEDAYVLPGEIEDDVYYSVKRTIDGQTVRYREKWAKEAECRGDTLNKQADSFITYSGVATSTITGLDHLEGKDVVVWADGEDFSVDNTNGVQTLYTVSSGAITLPSTVSNAVIGLPYTAQYKSVKLALQSRAGTSLLQNKRVHNIGFVLHKTLKTALKYGQDFDTLDPLPDYEDEESKDDTTLYDEYDEEMFEFDSDWSTDRRICLEAKAPRPCTVLACVIGVTMNEINTGQ